MLPISTGGGSGHRKGDKIEAKGDQNAPNIEHKGNQHLAKRVPKATKVPLGRHLEQNGKFGRRNGGNPRPKLAPKTDRTF